MSKPGQLWSWVIAIVGLITQSFAMSAPQSGVSASDALVDVLVWRADLPIHLSAYSPAVKAALEKHLQRSGAYRSRRAIPANSGEEKMAHDARVMYERQLVAVTDDPRAPAVAAAYVDRLRPCYEWEGVHDCPEREAIFADNYQAAHPRGPFREYLPLLAAHRWLCAAEAYEYEKQPDEAARCRRAYEQAILAGRRSRALLVQLALERLEARGRCFSEKR